MPNSKKLKPSYVLKLMKFIAPTTHAFIYACYCLNGLYSMVELDDNWPIDRWGLITLIYCKFIYILEGNV